MIEFHSIDKEVPEIDPELFVLALSALIAKENRLVGDVNIIVCSDEHLLSMNQAHLQHDYYTDIITFDYCEGDVVTGDLIVSVDTVTSNAELYKSTYSDELFRVVLHGVLHLCGLGDKSDEEVLEMRAAENQFLSSLNNPFV